MRVSDFIAKRLHHLGCRDVYMVTGGAAMHLNDAFGRTYSPNVHTLHHEQSCSIAAESYARVKGTPAIVNVTAGPGAINAINGVFGAYVDSIPMIVVSGQAKRETMMSTYAIPGLRQLGDQEVDIIRMVEGVCKVALTIKDPFSIAEVVDRCFRVSTSGRPGPVWLDVPIDVQSFQLPREYEEKAQAQGWHFQPCSIEEIPNATDEDIEVLARELLCRKRPVLYVGNGIRISESHEEFLDFLQEWPVPTVTAWNSNDLLWDDHPCYSGRPGTVGNRAGNFAVQFSECVITLGCRLNIRLVSFNWKSFAKNAWKCHVDIDRAELDKPTLDTDFKIHTSLKGLLPRLSNVMRRMMNEGQFDRSSVLKHWRSWAEFNRTNLNKFNAINHALPAKPNCVNPYRLVDSLSRKLKPGSISVCADGTACVVGFQASVIKKGQRLYHNSGCASMGYDLPAAIGAYHATGQEIICIAGDGSIMMNLQELAYIGGLSLPIKIILLNNQGYHSIRQTQNNYFPDNPVGCGVESGLPFPDFAKLAEGFAIRYLPIAKEPYLEEALDAMLAHDGPFLLEAVLDLEQEFAPKLASKKLDDGTMVTAELEDMSPLLGDDLLQRIRADAHNIS
jgi:acetolactate synthase I/II/III large subunit